MGRRSLLAAVSVLFSVVIGLISPMTALADTSVLSDDLISVSPTNDLGNNLSSISDMSADGRFVVFTSFATNLLPGVAGSQVYLRDRQQNVTELVSQSTSGTPSNRGGSGAGLVSADGRYVVFNSVASNLGGAYDQSHDETFVYLRDRQAGTTTRINDPSLVDAQIGPSAISADGNSIVYGGTSVWGSPRDSIYVYNVATNNTLRLPVTGIFIRGSISASGRYVGYSVALPNPDQPGQYLPVKAFRYDLVTGDSLEIDNDSVASGVNLSTDGRYALYYSNDGTGYSVNLKDLQLGSVQVLVSNLMAASPHVSMSTDNRYLAYYDTATVNGAGIGICYVKDLVTGQVLLVDGGLSHSSGMRISADGSQIAYSSRTKVVPPGATAGPFQAFVSQLGEQVDSVSPLVTGTPDRQPNAVGWYNDDVNVTWNATDPVPSSGAPTTPSATMANQEGTNTYTSGSSCDPAGNCAFGTLTLSIDKTLPIVSGLSISEHPVFSGQPVAITASAADALSGVGGGEFYIDTDPGVGQGAAMNYSNGLISTTTTISGLARGRHTMYVRSQDLAGNWSAPVALHFTLV